MLKSFFKRTLFKVNTSTGTNPIVDDPGQKYLDEQRALMNITKKNILVRFSTKLWQLLHYPINKINWLSFLAVITLIIAITIVIMVFKFGPKTEQLSSDTYSVFGQLKDLQNKHKYFYQVATPLEKIIKWKTMFYGWKYALNGDPKNRQLDCVGGVYTYYRAWGSYFRLESVPWLIKRIANLKERRPETIRRSINEVVSGDLIILKYSESNQHVGVVADVVNNRVRYLSINVGTMTEGEDLISFSDPAIVYIAEMCFELWAGDAYDELSKR